MAHDSDNKCKKKGVLAYYCQKGGYNDQNKLDAQRGNRRPLYECLSQLNPFSVLREKKKKGKHFGAPFFCLTAHFIRVRRNCYKNMQKKGERVMAEI